MEMREFELEERWRMWERRELERRVRVEREFEEDRRQWLMRREEKREEEEMVWRERMLSLQIEHEKQMMQMHANACRNQMQVVGVLARLVCQFLGSGDEELAVLSPQDMQNLHHSGGLMVDPRALRFPTIVYRPIKPSDLETLEQIRGDLFPIRYESELFLNVVNSRDIVSWGVVDGSCSKGKSNKFIGFVTVRVVLAKESEEDILDILGIKLSMPRERKAVIFFARDIVAAVATYVRILFKSLAAKVWKNEDMKIASSSRSSRWSKCKETNCLLLATQNKRIVSPDQSVGCQCVV
ncbi:hypothetical protein GIB67_001967 [Kingdonia uniflora]|uniref:Uncharacterized protein n=1 Tax=Kingdonia uniflora TaxID=39325 RepID=A0A7J7MA81_9MAGN|nr:hypothetical protein GIB67_001967 [Kingdonia uniflora]